MNYKKRKKALKKFYKYQEKEAFINNLPVSKKVLKKMFNYLNTVLELEGCSHDYTHVSKFIKERQLPKAELVSWFQKNGGYCDCEILYNVEQAFTQ